MKEKWLPGTLRERIQDLCKDKGVSQTDLAQLLDIDRSTLSRFLNEKTERLSDDAVIRMAKYFGVSTDFLLGLTTVPDRKNYDIEEIGLTVKASANLYQGKLDTGVVCQLLESPKFGELTRQIALYQQGTLSEGINAQNQLLNSVSSLLLRQGKEHEEDREAAGQSVQAVRGLQKPLQTGELQSIQSGFTQIVRELKKDSPDQADQAKAMTKEAFNQITDTMTKNERAVDLRSISPEQLIGTLLSTLSVADVPKELEPQMTAALQGLQMSVLQYFMVLQQAKELMHDQ